jgi:beta-lactamase class A
MDQNIRLRIVSLCAVFCLAALFLSAQSSDPPLKAERLRLQIERAARGVGGTVGVAAKHLESGEAVALHEAEPFPMASVFKVPVVVELMAQIREGRLSLTDEISLHPADQHLGSGILSGLETPGITLSIKNLMILMLQRSDNSATDILFNLAGADRINARLMEYGIEGISVDRSCQHLIMDAIGLDYEEHRGMSLDEVMASYRERLRENPVLGEKARMEFNSVPKDQSTPEAMTSLLEKVFRKEILDPESCELILEVMLGCQTGARRLKGDLPRGTEVAHKTGTIGGTVNDAGILYLPDGLGHVALTVFFKNTEEGRTEEVEDRIAQISRFVYDYFYFTVSSPKDENL